MIKEVPVVVPEKRYIDKIRCCDICGTECNGAPYYTTCDMCNKDICMSHGDHREDLVRQDNQGEYPPVCTECSAKHPKPIDVSIRLMSRCMELKDIIEKQNPSTEVLELLAHVTAVKEILDKE